MKPLRVVVVSSKYPPEYSGSGLRAHNTYRRLAQKYGIKFNVIASSVISNKNRRYQVDGVEVNVVANKCNKKIEPLDSDCSLKRKGKRVVNKVFALFDYVMEALPVLNYLRRNHDRYDVIHVFGNANVTSAAVSYAKITGKAIIVELVNLTNNPHQYEPELISLLFGRGFPSDALLVCISEYLRRVCRSYGYPEQQIWCRPNPVNENRFFYEPNRRSKYRKIFTDIDKSQIVLLHLAKFMPRKQQLFMVEAMSYLPANYKLILAGPIINSGPLMQRDRRYYQSILNTIYQNGLKDQVQLIPRYIEEPEKYMKATDVFVMPTTGEGLGTTVLEALACGVPIVANDIPGVFDQWVKDGVNGYICGLDHKEWAEKIIIASQIDDHRMWRASQDVLNVASTEVIDREYYERLSALSRKRTGR